MNFSCFRRLISQSASSGSVPHYCHHGMDIDDALFFVMSVTSLPRIQNPSQPCREDQEMHGQVDLSRKSSQDEELVVRTQLFCLV